MYDIKASSEVFRDGPLEPARLGLGRYRGVVRVKPLREIKGDHLLQWVIIAIG